LGKRRVRPKYWSHKEKSCDNWYEPITDWHLKWQNYFPKNNREITIKDTEKNIYHRADIKLFEINKCKHEITKFVVVILGDETL